jgi:multimeric flavodoxin WrbA
MASTSIDPTDPRKGGRDFLFIVASARRDGNTEKLARQAARSLPPGTSQTWLRLLDFALPLFEDIRHSGDGIYPAPTGDLKTLFDATLAATDLVFVTPLYWYSVPAAAKLYLDHWSGWMRVPGADFKARMAGKTMWAVTVTSDEDKRFAEPLIGTLKFSAEYMHMRWGGVLLGHGSRPDDIVRDATALAAAERFFAPASAR